MNGRIVRGRRRTWLSVLNFLVLQWAFVRLARVIDTSDGRQTGWAVLGPLVPMTGWWSDFRGGGGVLLAWRSR